MDYGHYNCRDYYITPHFAAVTITNDHDDSSNSSSSHLSQQRPALAFQRHESFDELEQRSRSPASLKPKFPLLRLPLELRQQIYSYLLPRTLDNDGGIGGKPVVYTRKTNVICRRDGEGKLVLPFAAEPQASSSASSSGSTTSSATAVAPIVWHRGNTKILRACRQVHDECADLLYGGNTFLLFVTYAGVVFRYSWLLRSGYNVMRRYPFLELMPARYLQRLRRVMVNVEHVDGYTGMIKFNVSGKGLVLGVQKQIQRLVDALRSTVSESADSQPQGNSTGAVSCTLTQVRIRISSANSIVDEMKRLRQGGEGAKAVKDLDEMLAPFEQLSGVRDVEVTGAVTDELARRLERLMSDSSRVIDPPASQNRSLIDELPDHQLCVYGNDIA